MTDKIESSITNSSIFVKYSEFIYKRNRVPNLIKFSIITSSYQYKEGLYTFLQWLKQTPLVLVVIS